MASLSLRTQPRAIGLYARQQLYRDPRREHEVEDRIEGLPGLPVELVVAGGQALGDLCRELAEAGQAEGGGPRGGALPAPDDGLI